MNAFVPLILNSINSEKEVCECTKERTWVFIMLKNYVYVMILLDIIMVLYMLLIQLDLNVGKTLKQAFSSTKISSPTIKKLWQRTS